MNGPTSDEVAEVRRAVVHLARRMRAERPAGALSPGKIAVLAQLHTAGPLTPGALAAAEFQKPQSLTRVLAELERAGLIVRGPDEHDRRRALVELTPAGSRALVADMADRDAWLSQAMTRLSETERGVLRLAVPLMDRLASG
jgi:DNA-binding MarR family transcriptional regulator